MKKKNSLLFILLMYSLTMLAQKDITKFMGIPVDGFKKDMIQKLKAKGFEYDNEIDLLTGEFNGEKVNIFIATQSNKVWRIVVADAIERNEHDIKIRFNNLYDQFNDNPKYVPKLEDNDYISEDINLAYEMKVRNKRFEAGFMQMTNPKIIMLMGRTSKKQIDEVHFCTSSICCPFVLLPALGNIRNTVCSCPDLWLHPPKDNT